MGASVLARFIMWNSVMAREAISRNHDVSSQFVYFPLADGWTAPRLSRRSSGPSKRIVRHEHLPRKQHYV